MRVEGLLEVARGQLVGHRHQVDHAAPVGQIEERAQVAGLEVVLDQAHRCLAQLPGGQGQVRRDRGRADPALGADHRDHTAHPHELTVGVARRPPADRVSPGRRRHHARFELLEPDRLGQHVAGAGLHPAAQELG